MVWVKEVPMGLPTSVGVPFSEAGSSVPGSLGSISCGLWQAKMPKNRKGVSFKSFMAVINGVVMNK
jgi:hypothetical protein